MPNSISTAVRAAAAAGIPIVYRGPWASKPAANDVPVGSVAHIQDTWTLPPGLYFVSDGTWWRPLNGSCLLYQWDLSALSYTSTALGTPAGFASPTFPWSYLLAVPGFQMDTTAVVIRTNPASTQAAGVLAAVGVNAAYCSLTNTNPTFNAAGTISYGGAGNVVRAVANVYKNAGAVADLTAAKPADAAVTLQLQTGGAGETMLPKSLQILYKA